MLQNRGKRCLLLYPYCGYCTKFCLQFSSRESFSGHYPVSNKNINNSKNTPCHFFHANDTYGCYRPVALLLSKRKTKLKSLLLVQYQIKHHVYCKITYGLDSCTPIFMAAYATNTNTTTLKIYIVVAKFITTKSLH